METSLLCAKNQEVLTLEAGQRALYVQRRGSGLKQESLPRSAVLRRKPKAGVKNELSPKRGFGR